MVLKIKMESIEIIVNYNYSLLGSGLFGLGSVLLWAILRSTVPRNNAAATVIGIASSYAIARLSYEYLNHVDSKAIAAA